jgi:hypothetical protein
MMAHTNKQGACVPWFHHYWIMHAPTSNQIIILHPPIPSCCPAYTHPITTSSHSSYRLRSTHLGGFPHWTGHTGSETVTWIWMKEQTCSWSFQPWNYR